MRPINFSTVASAQSGFCAACDTGFFGRIQAHLSGDRDGGHGDQVEFGPGDVIYREGQHGRHLLAPCRGMIKLEKTLPDGASRTVRLLQPGHVIGLELLVGKPLQHSAISVGRTRVCRMPVLLASELVMARPEVHHSLMLQWHASQEEADFVIAQLSTGPARQRVARLLLHLAKAHGSDVCQAPPRDDMASLLGLTVETVSRTTAALKREGLLSEQGGVFICDLARLALISEDNECAAPARLAMSL